MGLWMIPKSITLPWATPLVIKPSAKLFICYLYVSACVILLILIWCWWTVEQYGDEQGTIYLLCMLLLLILLTKCLLGPHPPSTPLFFFRFLQHTLHQCMFWIAIHKNWTLKKSWSYPCQNSQKSPITSGSVAHSDSGKTHKIVLLL